MLPQNAPNKRQKANELSTYFLSKNNLIKKVLKKHPSVNIKIETGIKTL
jgi:hypothetical protein